MADLSGDEGSTTGLSGCGSSRTKPNCVRCRNHGHKEPLKGHKRYCRYKDCKCSKCNFTFDRQKTMARQIALRRRNIQDELRKKQGLPVPSPSPPALQDNPDTPNSISSSSGFNSNTTNYPRSSCSNSNCNSNLSAVSSTSISSSTNVNNSLVSNPLNSPVTSNEVNNNNNNNSEDNSNMNTQQVRLESIFQLLEKLEYRPEIDSLLYIILQQVNSDVQKAYQKILMAQAEIRPLRALLKPDYSQQLPCKPLPLPLPLMPLHQYSYFLKPAASLQPTYLPSNVLSIPRQGEMFPWEYIPKSDYKADLPINLHTSSTNFKEV